MSEISNIIDVVSDASFVLLAAAFPLIAVTMLRYLRDCACGVRRIERMLRESKGGCR